MKKHFMNLLMLAWIFYAPVYAQTAGEDIFIGTFSNQQNGLLLSVKLVAPKTYEGFIKYQEKEYPFSGTRILGIVSGQYIFNGTTIYFSLAKIQGTYYLTSEGVSLEMQRTSNDPSTPNSSPDNQTPATSSQVAKIQEAVSTKVPVATGDRIVDPYRLFSFQLPIGWVHTVPESSGILITNTRYKAQIGLTPHHYSSLAEIRANTFDINDPTSNTDLIATVQDYGSQGLFIRYQGRVQGQALMLETIVLLSSDGGGLTITGSALQEGFVPEVSAAIKSVANSIIFIKTSEPALVQQWKQRLSNKQLLYLYTENGRSDKITIDLCPNGHFKYQSDGSYTSGGYARFSYAGTDTNSGSWKVVSKNTFPILVLFYSGGLTVEYTLVNRSAGNEINLNEKRYFIRAASVCN